MKTLEQQLSRLDLNLLVSLSVLLKEKNVSRSAEVLFLSQPAMSRTLKRLRDVFDDPLFYRESAGLQPTAKALSLQEPLSEILLSVSKLIDSTKFSPQSCDQTFKISLPPLMSRQLSVPLIKELMRNAPNASLVEYPASLEPSALLKDRAVDFSIHIESPSNNEEFPSELIGHTYAVFYGMANHPLAHQKKVTLEQCLKYQFVDLNLDLRSVFGDHNPIDRFLENKGLKRDIVFKSGQLNTLIDAMQDSDKLLISTHTLRNVDDFQQRLAPVLALKDEPAMAVKVYLIEHKRTLNSAAHQWLKQLILNTLRDKAFSNDEV
ncbi:LysR family transcriptional regulator [Vibrio sp. UCD-FRSSP16_10]|uniref:LysR family transcriptional regulator n=1 Tax=unclassified Vibrio TaxID=2614977 RepID=UPI000800692C|nr:MULTISPECIES: LysR family transcriptional regulator [unclassified Vibrio]OBT09453.1 LysR family transcriptional regulator [Vibrio sp. UCD-FRSSP16_30]OBT22132.1 LysR family transcriptional regulator [Vibrio sp. UCD-FRSSP16_10]